MKSSMNQGKIWSSSEECEVMILYTYMDVMELSKKVDRSALAISFKLVKMGLEKDIHNVSGFKKKWLK